MGKFQPIQAALEPLGGDMIDEYFEQHFCGLYIEIFNFTRRIFGSHELEESEWPWLKVKRQDGSDHLLNFVGAVARPGIQKKKWSEMLRDGEERSLLLQGIVMKALDEHVLSSPLFGATEEYQDKFIEKSCTISEGKLLPGFTSSAARTRANKEYLRQHGWPTPCFWTDVDHVAAQMAMLLKPLLYATQGSDSMMHEMHQKLHEIVAYAAWLNLGLRISPSITVVEWPRPGDPFKPDQVNMSDKILARNQIDAEVLVARTDLLPKRIVEAGVDLRFRVKIAVLPRIMRYSPGRDGLKVGIYSYRVMRPHAVFYQGWENDEIDQWGLSSCGVRVAHLNLCIEKMEEREERENKESDS
ncbi:hypothetical protein CDD82_5645 [Ophiocordyceps australis]|uniref:Uncharacterized protein n=1 Tax=Ophiocordyceps australis TaxID=1399860 RepID=A0A2C5ZRR1_9HYPO|nr:hypothetical protein CDD82_5645 [Ophiocordyceps australis]